jgi:hypothetical protein
MNKQLEQVWRDFFDDDFRHLDEACNEEDLSGAWGRFCAERRPRILATHPHVPGKEEETIDSWFQKTHYWIVEQLMREALSAPDSGHSSVWRPGPDGKLQEFWFKKGEVVGKPKGNPGDN